MELSSLHTSAVEFHSSIHGRGRRHERGIQKRDLQRAVLHGRKERTYGQGGKRRGEPRWKYTCDNIVYITDDTSHEEITSWKLFELMSVREVYPEPILIERVATTTAMQAAHRLAVSNAADPEAWTSHTVLVVDQSGSMRKPDMADCANRSDAVWVSLALDWVADQLLKGAKGTDVVSLVQMSTEADVLFQHEPVDWMLYNKLLDLRQRTAPKHHGNYLPALDTAESLLMETSSDACALSLMFLSDGKPSDKVPSGCASTRSKQQVQCNARVAELSSRFGRRLSFVTIGLAGPEEDFAVLESMANTAAKYQVQAQFHRMEKTEHGLSSVSLTTAVVSISSSLTGTRVEMTALGGTSQRKVRKATRETFDDHDEQYMTSGNWIKYGKDDTDVLKWAPTKDAAEKVSLSSEAQGGVAIAWDTLQDQPAIFGEGAERMVSKFRFVGSGGGYGLTRFVGEKLVAKMSRFEGEIKKEFHTVFMKTQATAQKIAEAFNEKLLGVLPLAVDHSTVPRIKFLDCAVYIVQDPVGVGERGYLVEKMLDPSKYMKWNSNNGGVDGQDKGVVAAALQLLDAQLQRNPEFDILSAGAVIEEADEEEDETETEDEDDDEAPEPDKLPQQQAAATADFTFEPGDIPQAFSHFSYLHSGRKQLVCDLQGVLSLGGHASPPLFELTDPVIHYTSTSGRKNVYGRTDRGGLGRQQFFATHKCNAVCKALDLSAKIQALRKKDEKERKEKKKNKKKKKEQEQEQEQEPEAEL